MNYFVSGLANQEININSLLKYFDMANNTSNNHNADSNNANKGTKGVNKTYEKRVSNEGKTKNPTWIKSQQAKGLIKTKKK